VTTTDVRRNRLTARDLLFDDPSAVPKALEQAIETGNVLESLPGHVPSITAVAARYVLTEAVQAIDGILGALHVDDMLMGGWMHLDELRTALEATTKDGGSRHVSLASHSISSEHAPSLELMLNEAPVRLLDLKLNFGFTIDACELLVRDGKVAGVELGSLSADGALGTATKTLIQHAIERIDINRLFPKAEAPS
jgi:hypothetical protein